MQLLFFYKAYSSGVKMGVIRSLPTSKNWPLVNIYL